jgi:hypothetical protein
MFQTMEICVRVVNIVCYMYSCGGLSESIAGIIYALCCECITVEVCMEHDFKHTLYNVHTYQLLTYFLSLRKIVRLMVPSCSLSVCVCFIYSSEMVD